VARRRHAAEAEVGGVGQHGGEQRALVLAALAGPQVGEGRGEAGRAGDVVQHLGDPRRRHQRSIAPARDSASGRGRSPHLGDVQAAVAQFHTLEPAARSRRAKRLSLPVRVRRPTRRQPLVAVAGRPSSAAAGRHRLGGQQVAVEAAVAGGPLHPRRRR
jgi:hypothetical protein